MTDSERLTYTVPEVAAVTNIGRNAVYEAINSGQLKAIHIGRRVLIPRNAVAAWVHRLAETLQPVDNNPLVEALIVEFLRSHEGSASRLELIRGVHARNSQIMWTIETLIARGSLERIAIPGDASTRTGRTIYRLISKEATA